MANQKNRKKELRQELKRQGITGQDHPKVVTLDKGTDITAIPTDAETVEIVEKPSFEEFAKNPELEGLSADKVKSLYDQGITSPEEIKNFKEEELLDIINYCYDTNYLTFSDIPKELIKEYIISEIGSIFSFETSNIDIKEVHCEE